MIKYIYSNKLHDIVQSWDQTTENEDLHESMFSMACGKQRILHECSFYMKFMKVVE